jgi:hypothetical protein
MESSRLGLLDVEMDVPPETKARVRLIGAAMGLDDGQVVTMLLDRLQAGDLAHPARPARPAREELPRLVDIHAIYRGAHVEGTFDRETHQVTITSGPLEGRRFPKPSPAAREVISHVAPDVNPHRNGWGFWIVSSSGQPLQTLRRPSP